MYVSNNSTLSIFPTDTTAVFGNIKVDGTILLPTKSFIYFFGETWRNTTSNSLRDETFTGLSGTGGTVRFSQPSPLGNNIINLQKIFGAYTAFSQSGTYFPNLQIDNKLGVYVNDSSDIAINNNLHFINGKIIVDKSNIVVGSPLRRGYITGYNQNNFVVTGGGLFGGFLYRLRVSPSDPDSTVFPIGASTQSYTPISLFNKGVLSDDFRARAFTRTYENGLFGPDISDQSSNKTWIVANTQPVFNASIRFQHIVDEEGVAFHTNRKNSYISHLVGNRWDTTNVYSTPKSPATITTGTTLVNAAMLTRSFNLQQPDSYLFAAFTKDGVTNGNNLLFTARRINPFLALLNLTVTNDNNVVYYEIQKRRMNTTEWSAVDTLLPSNTSGPHTYSWNDNDVYYPDMIQYRIRIIAHDGTYVYTDIRTIDGIAQEFYVQVFPNPGYDQFYLRIVNAPDAEKMVVYDNYGQLLFSRNITTPLTSFNLASYPTGIYYVVVYTADKKRLITEKVIKLNR